MIYLDNAATSFPKPESVYKRVDEVMRKFGGNPGRGGHRMSLDAARVIFDAREAAARIIGAPDASRISFTKNATEAINIAIKGVARAGEHVVTTTFEHNSVVKSIDWLTRLGVTATKVAPDNEGFLSVDAIERSLTPKTTLVALSHASNVFGTIQDVEAIGAMCRRRGVIFMVDGAQTVGMMPIDVEKMNIDILCATGHKALFGPQGTGFIYLKDSIEVESVISGGTGELDVILEMPDRLETGTINTPGIGGLGAGINFVLSEGVEKITAHERMLVGRIISGISSIKGLRIIGPLDASKRASLVAFTLEGKATAHIGARFNDDFSIMARCGVHCAPEAHRQACTHPAGAARVSPGYFTTIEEIDRLIDAVTKIARS